ncbi:unnamed protein product [Heterobilharzia americana]|nr:unnamed protein product [Heterobilharzia americana]
MFKADLLFGSINSKAYFLVKSSKPIQSKWRLNSENVWKLFWNVPAFSLCVHEYTAKTSLG